jgi:small nuclear ribonucleoprotein (snRNP)-like protein
VRLLALLSALFCSSFPVQLLADQVSLKNGDRLTGNVVKADGKTLVLDTDYAGDLNVNWSAIRGMQSAQELHVLLQDGRTVVGPVSGSNGKMQIVTKSALRSIPHSVP